MSYEFFKEEDYSVSCDKTVSRNNAYKVKTNMLYY